MDNRSENTRERLLQAAGCRFAQRGYAAVTVRDIAGQAGTNVGALNYHFGSKEQLYGAVLKRACEMQAIEEVEVPPHPSDSMDLFVGMIEKALEDYAADIEENWPNLLITRECLFPTYMFHEYLLEQFRNQCDIVEDVIARITGMQKGAPGLQFAVVCLSSMLDTFGLYQDLIDVVAPVIAPLQKDKRALARHLAALAVSAAGRDWSENR